MKKLILVLVFLFLAIPCQAKIITVDDDGPADFNNIQAAINAASEGDEVVVSIGTYHENINFGGKNIILCSTRSATPSVVSSTIIDGDFVGSVVRFSGSETESCVLSGFTITNGRASGGVGGGIYCPAGSSPTVTNCTIAGSRATGSGGGIGGAGNPTINNCIITGNKAVWDTGGGISLWGGSATIVNCTISGNLAYRGGGGIHSCNSSPTITNCTINANTAYKGAGIFCEGSSNPTIANCTIAGNSAEWSGGGINWAYSNPTLTNCTFVGNSAPNGSAIACGPCGSPPCMLQLTNCILWDGSHEIWNNYDSALTITYSDIQGGWPGTGNIDADPCFANPAAGDYHLLPDSACINAGDPNYVAEPNETDLDGKPRVIGGQIDMGAYEFQSPRLLYVDDDAPNDPGPGDPCVSDPLENGTQAHPFDAIQEAIDAAHDADTVTVAEGTYTEIINFKGKNVILTSIKPNMSNIVKRTTIEGMVVFRGTEAASCKLTGFNIDGYIIGFDWEIDPNGKNHTHATISHCVLENFWTGCGRLIYGCDGTISNCVIANISSMCLSPWPVPAIVGCHGLFKNCTFAAAWDGIKVFEGRTCTLKNCILYRHTWAFVPSSATLNISYCNFEDGRNRIWGHGTVNWGPGNIDTDPCFARLGDMQTEGDYHLKSQAGRWDPNSQTWVQDNITSPCIDAGDIHNPIGHEPFPNGGRVNMGAYGGTAEASKSYFGRPVCETIVAGDINGDCEVNFKDFALMALHWLECIEPNQGRWHLVEDDTEDSYSCEGNFDVSFPCSNAVDEDWDTYALPADGGAASIIYENYIIPAGIAMADFTIKYRQTASVTPGLCTDVTDYWDGSTWKELNCTALTNQISTLTVRIPDDALSGSALQLRTRIWKSLGIPGSGSGMYYEGKVIWYLLPVCQTIVAGDKKANEK